ncbi:MAG: AAA family ATPase [Clostridia bacterium]|nr:AAA family ATPase [Clostridia bacterium]
MENNFSEINELYDEYEDLDYQDVMDEETKNFGAMKRFSDTLKELKNVVVGQDDAVRDILNSVYDSLYYGVKPNINFIVGGSGTGKTLTFKTLSKLLDVPVALEFATGLSETGYVGRNIDEMLVHLLENSKQFDPKNRVNVALAENGILIIDEIAKKITRGTQPVGRDVSGRGVLEGLLPILNGDIVPVTYKDTINYMGQLISEEKTIMFDTRNLTIFLVDACIGLKEIREKRCGEKIPLGFGLTKKSKESCIKSYTESDLIELGFTNEFVGRISYNIIEFQKATLDSLARIVRDSHVSPLLDRKRQYAKYGIKLEWYDSIYYDIALETSRMCNQIGARALFKVVNKIFREITPLISDHGSGFNKIELKEGILKDPSKFEVS